jgi:hypothetical protein
MKFSPLLTASTALFAALSLSACGSKEETQPSAAAPAPTEAAPAKAAPPPAAEPAKAAAVAAEAPAPQDFGDFGSEEPLPRADQPKRGVISFLPKDGVFTPMDHWEQYDWVMKPKRWGHYRVRLNYELDHATLGVQLKFGETRLRKVLQASQEGHTVTLGELFIPPAEDPKNAAHPISIYAPQAANSAGFGIKSVDLVPIAEGAPVVQPEADGSYVLQAKAATTWSETMRYEPKPEKNCLGYWTNPDDFAEWEVAIAKPGKYQVIVTQGCGGGNAGSEVAVRLAGQEAKFTVVDTGGFQQWKEVVVGELEVKEAGSHYLVVDPLNKVKSAVLDVQKVVLKPV